MSCLSQYFTFDHSHSDSTDGSVRIRVFFLLSFNVVMFSWWGLVSISQYIQMGDHPFSAFRDCLFNVFPATVNICRSFLHPQREPCRGDRDPFIAVSRTHLSLWQRPTYRCVMDPLITVTETHLSLCHGPTYHWQRPTYHCVMDPLIVTGTHLSLCHGPTYHCDRGPLIAVSWAHLSLTETQLSLWQRPTYHGKKLVNRICLLVFSPP
jgi:hypothetical protein